MKTLTLEQFAAFFRQKSARAANLVEEYPEVVEPFLAKITDRLFGWDVDTSPKGTRRYGVLHIGPTVSLWFVRQHVNFDLIEYTTRDLMAECPIEKARPLLNSFVSTLWGTPYAKTELSGRIKIDESLAELLSVGLQAANASSVSDGPTLAKSWLDLYIDSKSPYDRNRYTLRELYKILYHQTEGFSKPPSSTLTKGLAEALRGNMPNSVRVRLAGTKIEEHNIAEWIPVALKRRFLAIAPSLLAVVRAGPTDDAYFSFEKLNGAMENHHKPREADAKARQIKELENLLIDAETLVGVEQKAKPKSKKPATVKELWEFTTALLDERRNRFQGNHFEEYLVVIQPGGRRSVLTAPKVSPIYSEDQAKVERDYGLVDPKLAEYVLCGNLGLTREDITNAQDVIQLYKHSAFSAAYEYTQVRPREMPSGQFNEFVDGWMRRVPVKLEQWLIPAAAAKKQWFPTTSKSSKKPVFVRALEYKQTPDRWPRITEPA